MLRAMRIILEHFFAKTSCQFSSNPTFPLQLEKKLAQKRREKVGSAHERQFITRKKVRDFPPSFDL